MGIKAYFEVKNNPLDEGYGQMVGPNSLICCWIPATWTNKNNKKRTKNPKTELSIG